ncbi:MAG: MMPL family transporter, partial [Candidatus Nanopelagicales bacterium]|nr:MMPL family transporter [Candidatus Nanopelagicales bacterium]
MPGLSAWAVRRPVIALVSWFVVLVAVIGLGASVGGKLNDSFSLPDTESTTAQELLAQAYGGAGSLEAGATIVWSPESGTAVDPAVLARIEPMLTEIAGLKSVACVTSLTGASLGTDCPQVPAGPTPEQIAALTPEQQAAFAAYAAAAAPISKDKTVAYSSVSFTGDGTQVSSADAKTILGLVKTNNADGLTVAASGQALEFAGQEPPSSELYGIAAAVIILLIAFGSLVAAGLPIVAAIIGLVMGQMGVLLVANFLDVATFAPTLAAMIGLGVGIDYSLFVINRYRQAVLAGHDPKDAALESVNTAGRAVLFAGGTVIIALLGLFVMRINFFNGLAVASAVTVLCVMLSALWMLPALLSLLGNKALALRLPWGKKPGQVHPEGRAWAHYGRFLQRKPLIPAALSLLVVLVLAIPMFSLRLGFADDSGKPEGSTARVAYDLKAEGFGPGVNGPFIVAVKLPKANDVAAYAAAVKGLESAEG